MIVISNKIFNRIFLCTQKSNFLLNISKNSSLISKISRENSRNFLSTSTRFSQQKQQQPTEHKSIIESSFNDQVSTHVTGAKRAKQAVKDAGNGFIILGGAGLLIGIFYFLFSELFSRESPSGIYDESSKICLENPQIQDALGHPIKVSAESGGRRVFQIKHKIYFENGQLFMILNYYLEGPRNKGDVYVKCKKNESTKKFEYEHIVVKLEYVHRGERKIIVKTNENHN